MRHYKTGRVEITDEPKLICVAPQDISTTLVRNVGDATVYVGGEDVTAETGMPILTADMPVGLPSFDYDIAPLYAVTAKDETGTLVFLVSS